MNLAFACENLFQSWGRTCLPKSLSLIFQLYQLVLYNRLHLSLNLVLPMYLDHHGYNHDTDSLHWCPVKGQEATGTNRSIGDSLWTPGSNSSLCRWQSTGPACPARWWSLHPWRPSKAIWTWSWTSSSTCLCLTSRIQPEDLWRSLATSTIV